MFIHLNSCHKDVWDAQGYWDVFYLLNMSGKSVASIILTLIKTINYSSDDGQEIAKIILQKLFDEMNIAPHDFKRLTEPKSYDLKLLKNLSGKKFPIWFIENIIDILDVKDLPTITNHPVHIKDDKGAMSPSSFIPFCSFGADMEAVGTLTEDFDIPICNSFKAKIKNDQLCYELDLQLLKNITNINKQLQSGLFLVLDYNEDRQLILKNKIQKNSKKGKMVQNKQAKIYLDTISKSFKARPYRLQF